MQFKRKIQADLLPHTRLGFLINKAEVESYQLPAAFGSKCLY